MIYAAPLNAASLCLPNLRRCRRNTHFKTLEPVKPPTVPNDYMTSPARLGGQHGQQHSPGRTASLHQRQRTHRYICGRRLCWNPPLALPGNLFYLEHSNQAMFEAFHQFYDPPPFVPTCLTRRLFYTLRGQCRWNNPGSRLKVRKKS